ncbi:MAG: hypothetical protein AAF437_04455 [Pseudomonadota bacterium]
MRLTVSGMIAGTLLAAACGQSAEVSLNETCNSVMADPQVSSDITRAGLSVDSYCDCATSVLLALPETERAAAISSFQLINTVMAEHDGDAEAAFEAIRNQARADAATYEARVAYQNLDQLGDQLDDLLDELEEADGVCPA